MSNAHYRYYNSAHGVGVLVVEPGSDQFCQIAGRVKLHGKKALSWVRRSELYCSVEEARGKPFSQFSIERPQ